MPTRPRLCLGLLLLLCGAVYLLGNGSVALWDRDEPRFAQTSRQMLQNGDWVVPHYLDRIRTAKPALIYWCQAAAMKVFGDNSFGARFPSSVAIMLLLIVLCFWLWRFLGPSLTVWTIFIFATSGLTITAAKMCITDGVLLLWVTIAQLCLYAMLRKNTSWPIVITMAAAIGLAGLTKGPVILGFQAMTLVALGVLKLIDRFFPAPTLPPDDLAVQPLNTSIEESETSQSRQARIAVTIAKCIVAILIIAAITLPWIILVNHRSSAFLKAAVGHEVWERMLTPLEQHKGPPGYYLITVWITFFPWSLFLPIAAGLAWHYRALPRTRFAIAAIVGPWILLECIQTKLPHYFLPVFPPLAYLTADAVVRCLRGQHKDLVSRGFVIVSGVWALGIAALASAPWVAILPYHDPLPYAAMIGTSSLGIVFGAVVFLCFLQRRVAAGAIAMGIGALLLVACIYGWYLPRASFLRLSPRVAKVLIDHGVTQPHQVLMMDYMEPSLAFDQGGTIRESGPLWLNRSSLPHLTPWLVVSQDVWNAAPSEVRAQFEVVAEKFGLAYANRGKWMNVLILKRITPGHLP